MQILIGTIKEISAIDPNKTGFRKQIVKLESTDNQSAFIEFRGEIMNHLEPYEVGQKAVVAIQMKTSVSKKSGIQFNNLIAKSIKPAA